MVLIYDPGRTVAKKMNILALQRWSDLRVLKLLIISNYYSF